MLCPFKLSVLTYEISLLQPVKICLVVCSSRISWPCLQVPDEFLDPVMADMMTDPVELPTSGTIMDRAHVGAVAVVMWDEHSRRASAGLA